jgi:hypothetical protein
MPVNTVKTHLHRALKSVRAQVAKEQAARHAASTAGMLAATSGGAQ